MPDQTMVPFINPPAKMYTGGPVQQNDWPYFSTRPQATSLLARYTKALKAIGAQLVSISIVDGIADGEDLFFVLNSSVKVAPHVTCWHIEATFMVTPANSNVPISYELNDWVGELIYRQVNPVEPDQPGGTRLAIQLLGPYGDSSTGLAEGFWTN